MASEPRIGGLGRLSGRKVGIGRRCEMKRMVNCGAALLAAIAMMVSGAHMATAGVIAGIATEWTQVLNNIQLVNSYIRLGEQLDKEIRMVLDMAKNSRTLGSQTFGPISSDIDRLARTA